MDSQYWKHAIQGATGLVHLKPFTFNCSLTVLIFKMPLCEMRFVLIGSRIIDNEKNLQHKIMKNVKPWAKKRSPFWSFKCDWYCKNRKETRERKRKERENI